MREHNLDYQLNSEQILAAVNLKKTGLQFLPSVDHDMNGVLNLPEVQDMLLSAYLESNLDNTKPIYLTMVLGGHDILIALMPDENGMQPYFIDSVGQDSNPNLEQRRKIAKDVVESLGMFVGDINVIKDMSVNQQFKEACGLAVVSNILSVQDAFDRKEPIDSKVLYQGENKEKYFQKMGDELVRAGVLPDKDGVQKKSLKKKLKDRRKAESVVVGKSDEIQQLFFYDVIKQIQQGKSFEEIKDLLANDTSGLNLSRVEKGNDGHKSLLEEALITGNVELFKWLVEEKGLQIADGISGRHGKFNVALPEENPNIVKGAQEIIRYIDERVDSKVKSDINLLLIATYYMDVDMCTKLIADPNIDINIKGMRDVWPVGIAFSNDEPASQKILELLLADDRVKIEGLNFLATLIHPKKDSKKALEFIYKFGNKFSQKELVGDDKPHDYALKQLIEHIDDKSVVDIQLYMSLLALSGVSKDRYKKIGEYCEVIVESFPRKIYTELGDVYFALSDEERQLTQDLMKKNDPDIHALIAIVADPVKLNTYAKKIYADPEEKKKYEEMKKNKGMFFPLNVVLNELKQIEGNVKADLHSAIIENDIDAAKKCIDQLYANSDSNVFYEASNYPVSTMLVNGRLELFNYLREKVPNLDLSRAIPALNEYIGVATLPCRDRTKKAESIDENKLKNAHAILKILDETLNWEGKKKINLFTLATYFLDVKLVQKFVNDPRFADVANEVGYRLNRPINVAVGGYDQDDRYKEIFDLLYKNTAIKNVLHEDLNFVGLLLDVAEFDTALEFLKDNIKKLSDENIERSLLAIIQSPIRKATQNPQPDWQGLIDVSSVLLKEILERAVVNKISDDDLSKKVSVALRKAASIHTYANQELGIKIAKNFITQIKPFLENGTLKLTELCKDNDALCSLLANNFDIFKNIKLSANDSAMLVGAISEEALNVLKKQNPLLHQFIEIARDPIQLDDFVNKLDRDKEFRAKYEAMKQTSNFFPLNIIDGKLQEVEQSRGFFGNLIKGFNDRFFPLKVDVTTTPILAELDKVHEIQTVAGTYKKAHRKIIDTSKQEDVNSKLESLRELKDEYDKTVIKIKSTEGAIDSTEALQKLNLKFLEILASPESISKTNKAELVREARVEYLSSAFTKEIAERIEKLYTIDRAEILQKTLQNTFKIIDTNKRLDPKAKIKQIEVLLKNVDMVLAHPSKDVKINISAITHTIPVDDKLAIKFKKKSSDSAERGA